MQTTKRDATFQLVLSPAEKTALVRLAERDGDSQAAIVRRLLRREAVDRGVWRAPSTTAPAGAQEVRP
jgi:hypothetical protein